MSNHCYKDNIGWSCFRPKGHDGECTPSGVDPLSLTPPDPLGDFFESQGIKVVTTTPSLDPNGFELQDDGTVTSATPSLDNELREKLARLEHIRWSEWQSWMHKVLRDANPSPEIGDILERWDRQIATPYAKLSEKEKDSDREQVDRYWAIVTTAIQKAREEAEIDGELALLTKMDNYYKSGSIKLYEVDGFSMYVDTRIRDLLELKKAKGEKR